MPKASLVSAVTHRLTLTLARPQAAVWRAFAKDVAHWWPADFYTTPPPHKMVFES